MGERESQMLCLTFDLHPIDDLPKKIKINTGAIVLIIGDIESVSAWVKARI